MRRGEVQIRGEVVHHTRDNLMVTFAANKLSNKEGFFSTSDPFLKISRYGYYGYYWILPGCCCHDCPVER